MNSGDLWGHMHTSWDSLSTTSWCHWEGAYLLLLLLVVTVIKEDFFFFLNLRLHQKPLQIQIPYAVLSGENKTGLGSLLWNPPSKLIKGIL